MFGFEEFRWIVGHRDEFEAEYVVPSRLDLKTKRFNIEIGIDVHDITAILNLFRRRSSCTYGLREAHEVSFTSEKATWGYEQGVSHRVSEKHKFSIAIRWLASPHVDDVFIAKTNFGSHWSI